MGTVWACRSTDGDECKETGEPRHAPSAEGDLHCQYDSYVHPAHSQLVRSLLACWVSRGFNKGVHLRISAAKHAGAAVSRGRALLDDLKGILRFLLL